MVLSKLQGKTNFLSLPGGEITDQPTYSYRGAMLDVARHFFSVADVKRYIDLLSIYKINFFAFFTFPMIKVGGLKLNLGPSLPKSVGKLK